MINYAYIRYPAEQVMQYNYSHILFFVIFSGCLFCTDISYAQESDYLYEDGVVDEKTKDPTIVLPDDHFIEKERSSKKTDNTTEEKRQKPALKTSPATEVVTKQPVQTVQSPQEGSESNTMSNPADVGTPEDVDSPLSFNFLYYIIQKFKFSDVIDE